MKDNYSSILIRPFPQLLYYLIIFAIPFYAWRTLSQQYPFLKIDWLLVIGLAILLIPYYLFQKRFFENLRTNLWPWLFLFIVINIISACLSKYPASSFDGLLVLIACYLFMSINLMLISEKGFRKILPPVLFWSVSLCAFLTTIGFIFRIPKFSSFISGDVIRGEGPTIGANNMALMSIFIFPLLVHWFFYGRNLLTRCVVLMLIVVNLLGLMSTFSRGGFLITAFMAILILFEQRNRFTMRYLGVILAPIAIFLLIGVMFVPEAYLQRQKSITLGREADTSTMRRAAYIDVALKSFQENPVLGTGPFTFKEVWVKSILARKFKIEERPAHNTYLEVLVGSGLVGLIIFLLLLWQALANFSYAKGIFRDMGDTEMASLVGAYRLSFISILIYFFIKSGLDHKFFLLALPLSEIALRMAKDKLNAVKK